LVGRSLLGVVKGLAVWLTAFAPSAFVGGVTYALIHDAFLSAVVTQALFAATSAVVAGLALRDLRRILGLRMAGLFESAVALVFGVAISCALAWAALQVPGSEGFMQPVPGLGVGTFQQLALALAIAPVGEEVLFRGLLLDYTLRESANPAAAIATSAVLFAAIHALPYRTAPAAQKVLVLITAAMMSVVAGYLRKRAGSIVPAIATHTAFNLGPVILALATQ